MENNNPPVPPDNENDLNKQFNEQFGNSTQNTNPNPYQHPQAQQYGQNMNPGSMQMASALPPAPNAVTAMVLGIIGLVLAVFWCYFITTTIGLVLSIIALILGNGSVKAYNLNPEAYSQSSLGQAKAGKVLGLIGMIVAILWFLVILLIVFAYATAFSRVFGF